MLSRSTQTPNGSQCEGSLEQPRLKNKQHPWPRPMKFSWTENFTRGLLVSAFVLFGYLALLPPGGINPAQGAATLATAGETASQAAQGNQTAGAHLFQTCTTWLQTSHAHAVLHAQDEPLPSQF